ncbi:MAG: HAD hydrolase family protein [Candidatus Caenarcaniphilales bacterium]|nr:HAD hydrolase family protein [Candidatus Caenarcaniphilales bacterium]
MNSHSQEVLSKLEGIKIIAFDIDGTLTDGSICMGPSGEALKIFNVKDGYAMRKAEDSGYKIYFITGRAACEPVTERVKDLRLPKERLFDKVKDKLEVAKSITIEEGISLNEIAYMGDDIPDLELLQSVGFSGVPSDAISSVKDSVDFISQHNAGRGAAREFIDLILSQNKK